MKREDDVEKSPRGLSAARGGRVHTRINMGDTSFGDLLRGRSKKSLRPTSTRSALALSGAAAFVFLVYWMSGSSRVTEVEYFSPKSGSEHAPMGKIPTQDASQPPSISAFYNASNTELTDPFVTAIPFAAMDPYQEHPIHFLMRDAEEQWRIKKNRQSRSFRDAVREYERRFGIKPPRGFDKWYEWATARGVQMIDEYNSIMQSLEPFFALDAATLKKKVANLEKRDPVQHAILHVRDGKIDSFTGADWRPPVIDDWTTMLQGGHLWEQDIEPFVQYLPDMDVAIHLHDGPMTILDWEFRERYARHARQGKTVKEANYPPAGSFSPWSPRERVCPADSNFRMQHAGILPPKKLHGPSFIRNHRNAVDYCVVPEFQILHGATSSAHTWISELEPSFTMSRLPINGDILWPASIQYDLNPEEELEFVQKPSHKLVWRGSLDGTAVSEPYPWRQSHRFRLAELMNSQSTTVNQRIRVSRSDFNGKEHHEDVYVSLKQLNDRFSDVRCTHEALQCDKELCDYVNAHFDFQPRASLEEMSKNRYVMDVDGNAYSARFRTHLLSNQVPFKSTAYMEWYSERIQPWLHYVPIRVDYTDLYDTLVFFDGDLEGRGSHEDLAEKIAVEGKRWAQTHWRRVDMQAYLFRLLLEYGRLFDEERKPFVDTGYNWHRSI